MAESSAVEPTAPTGAAAPSPTQSAQPPAPVPTPAPTSYPTQSYPQPYFAPQPRFIPFDKTWHWIKIGLTAASIVFCIILIGLSAAISVGPGYDSWNITIYWIGPLAGITAIWDIAEFITIAACGKRGGAEHRRGIHPGAHVGVDLCVWLAGIFCIFLSIMSYFSAISQLRNCQEAEEDDSSSSSSYRYYYYCDDDEYAVLQNGVVVPALRAIEAFIALLTLVHFIIFVQACIETNQRNRGQQAVMMVPPQMYYPQAPNMAPYGYPMMPPQAYTGGGQMSEKAPAVAIPPQNNYSNLAGFYAPAGPSGAHPAQSQVQPKEQENVVGSSSST